MMLQKALQDTHTGCRGPFHRETAGRQLGFSAHIYPETSSLGDMIASDRKAIVPLVSFNFNSSAFLVIKATENFLLYLEKSYS